MLRWRQAPKGRREPKPRPASGRKGRCLDYKELNKRISEALARLERDCDKAAEEGVVDGRAIL